MNDIIFVHNQPSHKTDKCMFYVQYTHIIIEKKNINPDAKLSLEIYIVEGRK